MDCFVSTTGSTPDNPCQALHAENSSQHLKLRCERSQITGYAGQVNGLAVLRVRKGRTCIVNAPKRS
ncbi:UNVERIFIED_CONTAM: hypothetical protein FKN15_048761 [Acipenser sinensis]